MDRSTSAIRRRQARRPLPAGLAIGAALIIGFLVCLGLNLPGHLSYDSVMQLWQGRTGLYNSWHPPVMAWMLGLADSLIQGASLFVVFDAALLYGGFLIVLGLHRRPAWAGLAVALVWMLSAQGLIYPAIVWKDVLFAGATTAGFAALAQAEARWADRRARLAWLGAAVLLLALAALARQNGAVVVVLAVLALGWIAARNDRKARVRSALVHGLGALVAIGLVVTAADIGLALRSDGELAALDQLEDLQTYDLSGAVKAQPSLRLDIIGDENPELEARIRADGARVYSPERLDSIQLQKPLQAALADTSARTIAAQWADLVFHHPALYLQVRAESFRWTFLTPHLDRCLPFVIGVTGPQPWLGRLGVARKIRPQDAWLEDYADGLVGTPLYSHAVYAVLAVVLIVVLWLRRRPGDIAIGALQAGALAFVASFFVIGVSCDYRYLYLLDVAAMVGAFHLALDPRLKPDSRNPII